MKHRIERINVLLRKEISRVLTTEIKDPRLSTLVSVTRVSCTRDLRSAKVFISVLGAQEDKHESLAALNSAAGYVHKSLLGRTSMKNIPSLKFILDESIERGAELLKLIEGVSQEPEGQETSLQ